MSSPLAPPLWPMLLHSCRITARAVEAPQQCQHIAAWSPDTPVPDPAPVRRGTTPLLRPLVLRLEEVRALPLVELELVFLVCGEDVEQVNRGLEVGMEVVVEIRMGGGGTRSSCQRAAVLGCSIELRCDVPTSYSCPCGRIM